VAGFEIENNDLILFNKSKISGNNLTEPNSTTPKSVG